MQTNNPHLEHIKKLIKRGIDAKTKILAQDLLPLKIFEVAEVFVRTFAEGGKLLFCGNGGSAADAQHLAAEFLIRFRKEVQRRHLPALALHLDSSSITACGNDFGCDSYYARLVEALGNPNDCLIAISTSGNSENLVLAVNKAKEKGLKTVGLLGCNGGKIAPLCDHNLIVDEQITALIQEIHIMIGHTLVETTENMLIAQGIG